MIYRPTQQNSQCLVSTLSLSIATCVVQLHSNKEISIYYYVHIIVCPVSNAMHIMHWTEYKITWRVRLWYPVSGLRRLWIRLWRHLWTNLHSSPNLKH